MHTNILTDKTRQTPAVYLLCSATRNALSRCVERDAQQGNSFAHSNARATLERERARISACGFLCMPDDTQSGWPLLLLLLALL